MTDLEKTAWDAMVDILETAETDTAFRTRHPVLMKRAWDALEHADDEDTEAPSAIHENRNNHRTEAAHG